MTFIKALLFPLAVFVALLALQYELWCLDDYWSATPADASSSLAINCSGESEIALDEFTCLVCSVAAPGDDDDVDDDRSVSSPREGIHCPPKAPE